MLLTAALLPASDGVHAQKKAASELSRRLDAIIEQAIAADEIPGAVLVVGHEGKITHRKAYGHRAVLPSREPMTVDTIFDVASLTKVIATASSVMVLLERGMVRLDDPVARYIPEFGANGKGQVTLRHLLTHTGGLRPVPRLPEKWSGADEVLRAIYEDSLVWPPGLRFLYSDTGFIVLGELVRRVSGKPLEVFAAQNIFEPLGMKDTRSLPPQEWLPRIAPTEEIDLPEGAKAGSGKGRVLRGVVHDPRARGMGGVAGHAGLFSTADDLAKYCQIFLSLLSLHRSETKPVGLAPFSWPTARVMQSRQTPTWVSVSRGLGWDIDSPYSSPRGDLFPIGASFGHTGFTGTSVWMNPASSTFVILLASSQHPYPRPALSSLRARLATAAASLTMKTVKEKPRVVSNFEMLERLRMLGHIRPDLPIAATPRPVARNAQSKTGIDVLAAGGFAALRGKRVGLITNHTGVSREGRSTIDLLYKAEGVQLVALFSPEHGIRGTADENVASGVDEATGLPIHSLYGETRRPTPEMLAGIDALVFDIQDAGIRFYTYITTMAYAMEEAAKQKIPFYVLDRPNPLGGERIEGPLMDAGRKSFVGYFPLPTVHGMTVGELAQLFNAENKIGAELHVVKMEDWRRSDTFESTGLYWIAPSPNLRSLDAALLYPGVEILQAAGVSVGRGTDTPFELLGGPWIHGVELANFLNKRFVPGVRFVPLCFTPREGLHKGKPCEGVSLIITDRAALHSMLMGLELTQALWKLYPLYFDIDKTITLVGNADTVARVKKGDNPAWIVSDWTDALNEFRQLRAKYLLYE
ncbi:MAG: exo-beta-N-acetylmuramidase NamZ domain-containing protein [Candidatus Acidiferrales bacterium]